MSNTLDAEMLETCPGCSVLFPADPAGAIHPYIGASAGCWALYTALNTGTTPPAEFYTHARVIHTPQRPSQPPHPALTGLLVDAYAAQHHGVPGPQAIQSVAVHLLVLHGAIVRGHNPAHAQWIRLRALRTRGVFTWLQPPPLGTAISLRHLFPGVEGETPATPDEYVASVYAAWAQLHAATLEIWYTNFVLAD